MEALSAEFVVSCPQSSIDSATIGDRILDPQEPSKITIRVQILLPEGNTVLRREVAEKIQNQRRAIGRVGADLTVRRRYDRHVVRDRTI
jgi:hypothetical protein